MQKIMRKYYEKLYANKLDNVEEMDKFIETHNLPKPNHEEMQNLNILIASNEIESVIKRFQQTKAQDPQTSQVNSIKHLKDC